ncbi:MAG TPA: hypothetical protein VNO21_09155, partial [Polyangiaceae bacterium]|nr:hypothetical protein [Polyangiaceae bacterium]
ASATKLALFAALGVGGAAVLSGCPIYDGNSGHRICDDQWCYDCPDSFYSNECVSYTCSSNNDCPNGYSCQNNYCVRGSGGGDCSVNGCPPGETCKLAGGTLQCVGSGSGDGGVAGDGGAADASTNLCEKEGVQDACASGSVCLNHNCYIACAADAGANACKGADKFNVCKPVAATSGTYYICGSDSNLGNECDTSKGRNCPSPQVCIDGYCK